MNRLLPFIICIIACITMSLAVQAQSLQLAVLKYGGGGDWYANPTALKNLADFCNKNIKTHLSLTQAEVEPGSPHIFNYPYINVTGHGRIAFTKAEADNIRAYLTSGGFLHIDDNYGLNNYVRPEMKKVFPELDFVELPFSHPIFHQSFKFPKGIPKIHEHDGLPAQAFGLIYKGRLVCLYTFSTDLGDGWEDPEVHPNTPEKRLQALQMGANIIEFVFNKYGK